MARDERCPDFAAILAEAAPDAALQEQVAECFRGELGRLARARCSDWSLAEDAAQDALINALQSLGTFRGDAPIDHWLSRLVVSACSRLRRGRKNDPAFNLPLDARAESIGPPSELSEQEAKVFLDERIAILKKALEEESQPNRDLLLLHEGEGVPLAELAQRFDMTVDSVKARLKRSRARLRQRLIAIATSPA